jgi:hypothetical protein
MDAFTTVLAWFSYRAGSAHLIIEGAICYKFTVVNHRMTMI